jgi:hypothetical protein
VRAFTSSNRRRPPGPAAEAGRRHWYSRGSGSGAVGWLRTSLLYPAFSPDGTKIAYIDGMGDWGNGLRVMDTDGRRVRVLLDSDGQPSDGISITEWDGAPVWSPGWLAACILWARWHLGHRRGRLGTKEGDPQRGETKLVARWLPHRAPGQGATVFGTASDRGRKRRWQRSEVHLG